MDSRCQAGCALLAVTVAASDRVLLSQARDVFQLWRARLAEQLMQGGLSPDQAKAFAAMLITSVEGAVALCRAAQSPEVFDMTATMLMDQLKSLVAARSVSPSGSRRAAAT